jgi:hypothetical protein
VKFHATVNYLHSYRFCKENIGCDDDLSTSDNQMRTGNPSFHLTLMCDNSENTPLITTFERSLVNIMHILLEES